VKIEIGTIIRDNGKIGIVTSIMKNGVWKDDTPLKFTKTFEIKYSDGIVAILTESSLFRLIKKGKIEIVAE